ncbi:hypothetical protein Lser_V15G08134 [Lactuca serriola]
MGGSENRSNRRNMEEGAHVWQKEAAKFSAANSTNIAPPQHRTVVGFGDKDDKDSLDSRKACNMGDLIRCGWR